MEKYDISKLEKEQVATLELLSEMAPSNEEYGKGLESVKTLNRLIIDQRKLNIESEKAENQRALNREIELKKLELQKYVEDEKSHMEEIRNETNAELERQKLELEREMGEKKLKQDRNSMWLGFAGTMVGAMVGAIGTYLGIKTVGNVYDKALAKEEDGVINTRALNTGDGFNRIVSSFMKK